MVELLVEYGGDIHRPSSVGNTPLHFAAWQGHRDLVSWLLEHKVRVDTYTRTGKSVGWTPLHVALLEKHKAIVQLLLEHGAKIGPAKPGWSAPLHAAAQGGGPELIRLLVRRGADVNVEISHTRRVEEKFQSYIRRGLTPLHIAVREGHLEAVEALLALGANTNTFFDDYRYDDDGGMRSGIVRWTPLMAAVSEKNLPMVRLLLQGGASTFCRGRPKGYSAWEAQQWLDVFQLSGGFDVLDGLRVREAEPVPETFDEPNGSAVEEIKRPPISALLRQAADEQARFSHGKGATHTVTIQGQQAVVWASSELVSRRNPGAYAASKAFDGDLNTAWVEGVGEARKRPVAQCEGTLLPEKGQGLTIRFQREQRLRGFVLYPGYMKSPALFQSNLVPRRIRIDLDGESVGEYELRYIERCVKDVVGLDAYSLPAADERNLSPKVVLFPQLRAAREVTLTIVAAVGGARFRDLAIAEWQPILQNHETRVGSTNLEPIIRTLEQVRSIRQEGAEPEAWPSACNPIQLVGWQNDERMDIAPLVRIHGNISWFGPKNSGPSSTRFRRQIDELGESQRDSSAAYYCRLTGSGWVDHPVSVFRVDGDYRLVGSWIYSWSGLGMEKSMYPTITLNPDGKVTELSAQFKSSDEYCYHTALPPIKPEHLSTVSEFCKAWIEHCGGGE